MMVPFFLGSMQNLCVPQQWVCICNDTKCIRNVFAESTCGFVWNFGISNGCSTKMCIFNHMLVKPKCVWGGLGFFNTIHKKILLPPKYTLA